MAIQLVFSPAGRTARQGTRRIDCVLNPCPRESERAPRTTVWERQSWQCATSATHITWTAARHCDQTRGCAEQWRAQISANMIGQRVKKKNRKTNSNTTITNHVTSHTLRKYQRFTGVFASGSTAFMSYLLPSEPSQRKQPVEQRVGSYPPGLLARIFVGPQPAWVLLTCTWFSICRTIRNLRHDFFCPRALRLRVDLTKRRIGLGHSYTPTLSIERAITSASWPFDS